MKIPPHKQLKFANAAEGPE